MTKTFRAGLAILAGGLCLAQAACWWHPDRPPQPAAAARAVVLLVGDGLGDAEITAARNFGPGAEGRLELDALAVRGWSLTASVQEAYPHLPDYVVDSAASATAWATGKRTSNGRISTAAGSDAVLPTVLEQAQAAGIPVGVVTTSEITDATPAALFAHVNSRWCQGPADMRFCPRFRRTVGGPGSIAEQALARRIDVLLGGGRQRFEQPLESGTEGRNLLEVARQRGDRVLLGAQELAALEERQAPVLGLFAAGDFARVWRGEPARPFPGSGPQACERNQRPPEQPALPAMVEAALRLLHERARERGKPFFLQIEGANIDKSAHAAEPCEQVGETLEFDAAVGAVLRYAAAHPDTLVIVTADHAHATQIVPFPLHRGYAPGLLSTLVTSEGGLLTLAYATQALGGSQTHTGSQVPILAQGPYAERLAGTHAQTDLYWVIRAALDLSS
jgi:alkaline phosphatase/streptomycin-6-phosphatase